MEAGNYLKTVLYKSRKLFKKRRWIPAGSNGPMGGGRGGWKLETCRKRTGNVLETFENPLGGTCGLLQPAAARPSELEAIKKRFDMEAGNDRKTFPHQSRKR